MYNIQSSHGSLSKWMLRTVDGSEILRSPVEIGSLSHCLQGLYRFPGGAGFLPSTVGPKNVVRKSLAFDRRSYRHVFLLFSVAEFGRLAVPETE